MSSKSKNLFETNIVETPLLLLLLLIPFVLVFSIGSILCGISDALDILKWVLVMFTLGLSVLPIGFYIFKDLGSGGFFVTKILGILLVSLFTWELTYIGIYRFSTFYVWFAVVALSVISYGIKPLRDNFIKKIKEPMIVPQIVIEETVFVICLVILCYFKGLRPDINGEEKFMDYGFMMSMLRNPELPAKDMWLAGYQINYYYFGQFVWALITKISGVYTGSAYTLAMCSAIAVPFTMAFSIGCQLMETNEKFGGKTFPGLKYIAGILSAFAVAIFGNSHSFFYDENSIGNKFIKLLGSRGVSVGNTDDFYYPDSTRFIGWNPKVETNGGDCTIEEFPFYSYLVGDLHAHVISMMVILLIISIAIVLISNIEHPTGRELRIKSSYTNLLSKKKVLYETSHLLRFELISIAILLGVAQMTNYWDFLIYFIFTSMAMLIYFTMTSRRFSDYLSAPLFLVNVFGILIVYLKFSENVLLHICLQLILLIAAYLFATFAPSALTRTGCGMSLIFTISYIVAAPFNYNFDMISNSLGKCVNHTALYQLFILWGTHVIIGLGFFIITICYKNYSRPTKRELVKKNYKATILNVPANGFTNPVQKFFGERNLIDIFICGMFVVSILLIIAPEIFYVRDIYTGGYLRANTMFKFAFAAFIILSLVMSYAVLRLFWIVNKSGRFSNLTYILAILFALMLFIPGHYTGVSLKQRSGDYSKENYSGLDGTSYLVNYYSKDGYIEDYGNLNAYYEAIKWFNKHVTGSPVICEAYGESYSDYNITSAYTGLPSVIGWQTHEWLWRFHGIVDEENDILISDPNHDVWQLYLTPRYEDIDIIYTSSDLTEIQKVINKYQIEYIIIGNLEYSKYDYDNSYILNQLGETVFVYDNLNIIKVKPYKFVSN